METASREGMYALTLTPTPTLTLTPTPTKQTESREDMQAATVAARLRPSKPGGKSLG